MYNENEPSFCLVVHSAKWIFLGVTQKRFNAGASIIVEKQITMLCFNVKVIFTLERLIEFKKL